MARRHVAEAEVRIGRQREILAEMQADDRSNAAVVAQRLLVTMEATLSVMRDHLQFEEQRFGSAHN
jgi:uncharacterized protein (DUF2267 family)